MNASDNGPIECGDYYRVRFPGIGVFRYQLYLGLPGITVWRGGLTGWVIVEDLGIVDRILEGHESEIKISEIGD